MLYNPIQDPCSLGVLSLKTIETVVSVYIVP